MKTILRTALIVLAVVAFDTIRTFPLTGMRLDPGMTWGLADTALSHAGYDKHLVSMKGWFFENMIGEWRFNVWPSEDREQRITSKQVVLRIGSEDVYSDVLCFTNDADVLSISLLGLEF